MKHRLFILLGILTLILALLIYSQREEIKKLYTKPIAQSGGLQITFLDIGQGDASFIEWGDGTQMLVDCAIDARILEALGRVMNPRDRVIDYLLVTHPDQDHYGGCVDVLKRFEVKNIVYTGYNKSSSNYFPIFEEFVRRENAQYVEIQHQQIWDIASSTIHFLYPDKKIDTHPVVQKMGSQDASNNTSIVFILEYGKNKILFTGDAELETEEYLVETYGDALDVDVLKVGHHGSAGSSSDRFLGKVKPELAMISSGRENRYGHPHPRTLKRLERVHAQMWRTDEVGDIILFVNNDNVYVEKK